MAHSTQEAHTLSEEERFAADVQALKAHESRDDEGTESDDDQAAATPEEDATDEGADPAATDDGDETPEEDEGDTADESDDESTDAESSEGEPQGDAESDAPAKAAKADDKSPKAQPQDDGAPEWYKGLPDEAKQAIESLDSQARQERNRANAAVGRVRGLQQQIQTLEQRLKSNPERDDRSADAKAPENIPQTPEEWEKYQKEWPEEAKAIQSLVKSYLGSVNRSDLPKGVAQRLDQLEAQNAAYQQKQAEQAYVDYVRQVEQAHPDVHEIVQDPIYHTWLQSLPPATQQTIKEIDTVEDTVYWLNQYKADLAAWQANREPPESSGSEQSPTPAENQNPSQQEEAERIRRRREAQLRDSDTPSRSVATQMTRDQRSLSDEDAFAAAVRSRHR